MHFIVKKTSDLTDVEKEDLVRLFDKVFGKPKDIAKFDRQFSRTHLGYAFHGLMKDQGGRLVGCYSSIPVRYSVSGTQQTFGLCVDTMISENARGNLTNIKRMAELTYDAMREIGIPFVFGFPNENIYLVRRRLLKWRDIGNLDYFVLPLRPDYRTPALKVARPLFLAIAKSWAFMGKRRTKDSEIKRPIQKIVDKRFRLFRYGPEHIRLGLPDGAEAVFTVSEIGGLRAAFLIDVEPLTGFNMDAAVAAIARSVSDIGAVVYVGGVDAAPRTMFRLPQKFWPKPVRMAGRILDPTAIDERVFSLQNWRVNFSDFDVV